MDCAQVRENLEGYLAGEISAELSAQIAAHLLACRSCHEESQELAALTERLRKVPDVIAPHGSLLPASMPQHRSPPVKPLVLVAAVLVGWAVFSGALLLWPSLAGRLSFLPVARTMQDERREGEEVQKLAAQLRAANLRLQRELSRRAVAPLPAAALESVQALLHGVRAETTSQGEESPLTKALVASSGRAARRAQLATIRAVETLPERELRLHLDVLVTYQGDSKPATVALTVDLRRDARGAWTVTKVSTP